MQLRILLSLFLLIIGGMVSAQQDSSFLPAHPYLPLNKRAIFMIVEYHGKESKDALFYALVVLVFLLGFIKTAFPKYFQNLFKLFFQTSLRQKQTKEQLAQDSFASLLINLLFLLSTGMFITLVIQYNQWIR